MSDSGVPLENIADLCGHTSTAVTEEVYRHQLKPVITKGAEAIDAVFGESRTEAAPKKSASESASVA
jgi:integrase